MRIINLSLLLLILPNWANCQLVYDAEAYKKVVRDFYDHIFHKKFSSLKDYNTFFGQHSEDEEVLFFKKCDNGKLTPECVKKARERNSTWSSHESLIFLELKKVKQEIATEDNMTAVLRKMKLVDNGIPDAI